MDHRKNPPKQQPHRTQFGHLLSLRPIYLLKGMDLRHPEKPRDGIRRRIRTFFCILLLLLSLAFAAFTVFFPSRLGPYYHPYKPNSHLKPTLPSGDATSTLNLSHLFFGIGGSAETWESRRSYIELWWRPDVMRGHVWLDQDPPGGAKSWSPRCPPYRVSGDATRFGPRVSAARIARVVKEAYLAALEAPGSEEVRWLVMGDDDTVFLLENLLAVLRRYDHREMWYIGGVSESVEQAVFHSYAMAYGGGGFAVSLPAVAEISRVLDRCLLKYFMYYGSDQRVQACMSELGVPLTKESGFHQMDIRGSPFGLLAAHPVAPMVSLHHIDYVDPIFPGVTNRTDALKKLIATSHVDPSRTLQQSICYEPTLQWSVSVSWGYTVQVYPRIVAPDKLQTPLLTFQTWGSFSNGPFNFNTRLVSRDPCLHPAVFFLESVRPDKMGTVGSVTEYRRYVIVDKEKSCTKQAFLTKQALLTLDRVETVRVIAPIMDPDDWTRAPRRHCCETKTAMFGGSMTMNVWIRKCGLGETASPP